MRLPNLRARAHFRTFFRRRFDAADLAAYKCTFNGENNRGEILIYDYAIVAGIDDRSTRMHLSLAEPRVSPDARQLRVAATSECSGSCPSGYYSATFGLDSSSLCDECPVGYRGWQCTHALTPRRGHFISTDGHIDERSHAYVDGEKIPQGLSPVTWVDLASPLVNKATGPYDA